MNVSRDILVLGASNEISPHSYLKSVADRSIINASVGGCGSLAGIVMLGLHEIPANGYCLLNYELNENGILRSGLRTEVEVRQIWQTLIEATWARNATPIIFTLPRLIDGKLIRTPTCDVHVSIAKEAGIPYFDGAKLFTLLCESGVNQEDLMLDNAHITERSHRALGAALNTAIQHLDKVERFSRIWNGHASPFSLHWAKDLDQGTPVQKKSSLSVGNLRLLTEADRVEITLNGPGLEFIGVSINRKSLGAALMAPGLCKHLIYEQAGLEGFMRVVADVRARPIAGQTVEFTLAPTGGSVSNDVTWLAGKVPKTLNCSLEVECFIFKDTKPVANRFEHQFAALADCDLWHFLGPNFVEDFRRAILQ